MSNRLNKINPPPPAPKKHVSQKESEDICAQHDALITGVVSWNKWNFDPHTKDDVAQLIRLDALKSIPKIEEKARIQSFIKKIAIRRCIDEVRRQIRSRKLLVFPSPPAGEKDTLFEKGPEPVAGNEFDPIHSILLMERAKLVRNALKQLSETCAATIEQFYFHAVPYKIIAEKLGISINTVASRLSRCMEKLKHILMKAGNSREELTPLN